MDWVVNIRGHSSPGNKPFSTCTFVDRRPPFLLPTFLTWWRPPQRGQVDTCPGGAGPEGPEPVTDRTRTAPSCRRQLPNPYRSDGQTPF